VNEGGSHDTSGKVDGIGRPLRSWLFTPASRPDRFGKAAEVGADVLVLDLEDAVAPADKEQARATAIGYLGRPSSGPVLRALRINGLDTRAGLADLHALLGSSAAPDLIVLPKTDSPAHLQILDRLLTAAHKDARLVGLVESARGLLSVQETAAATPRLAALMFGAADMAADLGATVAWEPLVSARCQLVAACARCGVLPIDSPFFDIHDSDGLSSEITRSALPRRRQSTRRRSGPSTWPSRRRQRPSPGLARSSRRTTRASASSTGRWSTRRSHARRAAAAPPPASALDVVQQPHLTKEE
jgi:(S)-citramalyl-CoA lyase